MVTYLVCFSIFVILMLCVIFRVLYLGERAVSDLYTDFEDSREVEDAMAARRLARFSKIEQDVRSVQEIQAQLRADIDELNKDCEKSFGNVAADVRSINEELKEIDEDLGNFFDWAKEQDPKLYAAAAIVDAPEADDRIRRIMEGLMNAFPQVGFLPISGLENAGPPRGLQAYLDPLHENVAQTQAAQARDYGDIHLSPQNAAEIAHWFGSASPTPDFT